MKEKNRDRRINRLIESTMKTVGMDIEIKQEQTGVNMSYNFIFDYVGIDMQRVNEAIKEMHIPVSIESYIKTFTLHELGHALDRKALLDSLDRTLEIFEMKRNYTLYEQYNDINLLAMLIEEHKMNIDFEEKAWMNAEELNKKYGVVDWGIFEKLKDQGMATYMNLYKEDLQLYSKLVAENSEKTA